MGFGLWGRTWSYPEFLVVWVTRAWRLMLGALGGKWRALSGDDGDMAFASRALSSLGVALDITCGQREGVMM